MFRESSFSSISYLEKRNEMNRMVVVSSTPCPCSATIGASTDPQAEICWFGVGYHPVRLPGSYLPQCRCCLLRRSFAASSPSFEESDSPGAWCGCNASASWRMPGRGDIQCLCIRPPLISGIGRSAGIQSKSCLPDAEQASHRQGTPCHAGG